MDDLVFWFFRGFMMSIRCMTYFAGFMAPIVLVAMIFLALFKVAS